MDRSRLQPHNYSQSEPATEKEELLQMSSSEEGYQSLTSTGAEWNTEAALKRKRNIILVTVLVLCVGTILAVCAAFAGSSQTGDANGHQDAKAARNSFSESATASNTMDEEGNRERQARRASSVNRNEMFCYGNNSTENSPAAHISGFLQKWEGHSQRPPAPLGYEQHWKCGAVTHAHSSENTFVDGGTYFNQTDKSIYVPRCGNYYIYSQILFGTDEITAVGTSSTIHYTLRFKRNCRGESSGAIQAVGTVTGGNSVTIHTGYVVTLCRGGRVYVEIPHRNPCCPVGDELNTFIGVMFVSDAQCKWPPRIAYDTV